jgi:type II secretory pathway pseudopilin PulG
MSDERGFTLTEVLVAATMMIVVLSAVLTTFNGFERTSTTATERAEAQEKARTAIDRISREIRNAVSAGAPVADSVERADAYDLMFQTVGAQGATTDNPAAKIRVRYCLDLSDPANGKLYRQAQVASTPPSTTPPGAQSCPGPSGAPPGWNSTTLISDRITNRLNGQDRPVFQYRFTPDDSMALAELTSVTPALWVDVTPEQRAPTEVPLRTAIQLRNANQPPVAAFTARQVPGRKLAVDASQSFDPERRELKYAWYVDGIKSVDVTTVSGQTAALAPGAHTVRLVVTDIAFATNETSKTVTVQ